MFFEAKVYTICYYTEDIRRVVRGVEGDSTCSGAVLGKI
jgi:hypothetical protein